MKYISEKEQQRLDRRVVETEQRTGAQVVLAVVGRCDAYPEIPWKALALAVSLAGLAVIVIDILRPNWRTGAAVLIEVSLILAAGGLAALTTVLLPAAARFFLDRRRAEAEARQYAESLFLSRQIFATSDRMGILLCVGIFERQVVILPDTGLAKRLGTGALQPIIGRMTPLLAVGSIAEALEQGLLALEEALASTAPKGPGRDELPNAVVQEDGA